MYQYTERTYKKQGSKAVPHMQVKKMPVHVVQRTLKLMDKDTDFAEFIMLKDKDAITRYCRDHEAEGIVPVTCRNGEAEYKTKKRESGCVIKSAFT